MHALRVCLFLLAALILPSSLHASTRLTTHRLTASPAAFHRANATVIHHLAFPYHFPPALDLPAEPLQSSINPPSPTHGFSLISFAIHSVLGLFRHSPA